MADGHHEKPRKAHGEHEDRGPKGGTTTLTASGMVKKNLWVTRSMAERLREEAYERRTSEPEIIRQALTRHFRQTRTKPDATARD